MLYLCCSATDVKNRINLSGLSNETSETVCKRRCPEAALDNLNCFHGALRTDYNCVALPTIQFEAAGLAGCHI